MQSIGHRSRKRFGQHFLRDPLVIQRILNAIKVKPEQHLLEIGPGLGAITLPVLEAAQRLEVVELDRDLIPRLQERCRGLGELRIHQADALTFDLAQLCRDGRQLRVLGNLPYNISTPLLFHLLEQANHISDMHFMLQREVVERMAAAPNETAYGRLSVMLQYRCRVEPLFSIGPEAFSPRPKVESAFVRLLPYPQPPFVANSERRFAQVVRQAFSQRRKMLRNSLRGVLSVEEMAATGIDPDSRPQALSLSDFIALSNRMTP